MRINEAVQVFIHIPRELNQAMVARESGINAGQLSRWIKEGANLSRKKQGELAIYLLDWFENLGEKRKTPYLEKTIFVEAKGLLERFEPYHTQKAAQAPLDALSPVSPHHP